MEEIRRRRKAYKFVRCWALGASPKLVRLLSGDCILCKRKENMGRVMNFRWYLASGVEGG